MNEQQLQELEKTLAELEAEHIATITLWTQEVRQLTAMVRMLQTENADGRAKLDAVPDYVDYRRGCSDFDPEIFSFDEWYERFGEVQP